MFNILKLHFINLFSCSGLFELTFYSGISSGKKLVATIKAREIPKALQEFGIIFTAPFFIL